MGSYVFPPSSSKTAVAPVTVVPSGLSCVARLTLSINVSGTPVAATVDVQFTSTGAAQNVSLPITFPAAVGVVYKVLLDILYSGSVMVGYIGTDDIVIPSATVGPIVWS